MLPSFSLVPACVFLLAVGQLEVWGVEDRDCPSNLVDLVFSCLDMAQWLLRCMEVKVKC